MDRYDLHDMLNSFCQLLLIVVICFGFMAITYMMSTESMPGLHGKVEKVVVVHGEDAYSIITVDGEEYKFDGDVAPREGDEIAFALERHLHKHTMKEWHLAD